MPYYNAAAFLNEAVSSILNQTFSDFELIILDDASTDESVDIIQQHLDDPRVRYYRNEKNQGIVHNLNKGLSLARADIIARMDGDDVAELNRFELQYNFLQHHPDIAAVGSYVRIIDENGVVIDQRTKLTDVEAIRQTVLVYSPLVHPAAMYRRDIIAKVGGYRQQYLYNEDIDLWYRLIGNGYAISNVPEYLLRYRYHGASTAHRAAQNAKQLYRLRKETIQTFKLRVSMYMRALIFIQLFAGIVLTGRQRQMLEGVYKKLVYHEK